jgi:hypothetical protein
VRTRNVARVSALPDRCRQTSSPFTRSVRARRRSRSGTHTGSRRVTAVWRSERPGARRASWLARRFESIPGAVGIHTAARFAAQAYAGNTCRRSRGSFSRRCRQRLPATGSRFAGHHADQAGVTSSLPPFWRDARETMRFSGVWPEASEISTSRECCKAPVAFENWNALSIVRLPPPHHSSGQLPAAV